MSERRDQMDLPLAFDAVVASSQRLAVDGDHAAWESNALRKSPLSEHAVDDDSIDSLDHPAQRGLAGLLALACAGVSHAAQGAQQVLRRVLHPLGNRGIALSP